MTPSDQSAANFAVLHNTFRHPDDVVGLATRLEGFMGRRKSRFFDLDAILADGEVLDPRNSFDGVHPNGRVYLLRTAALAPRLRDALR
jgi:hypothetical protein